MFFDQKESYVPNIDKTYIEKMVDSMIDTEKTVLILNYPDSYLLNDTINY